MSDGEPHISFIVNYSYLHVSIPDFEFSVSLIVILLGSNNGKVILNSAPFEERFFPWSVPPNSEMIFDDIANPNPKPFPKS